MAPKQFLFSKNVQLSVLLLIFGMCGCGQLSHQTAEKSSREKLLELDLKVHRKVFENGLTALVVENPGLPLFSYRTLFRMGSKHELMGQTGATHFLEHLMFKGTEKFPLGSIDQVVEGSGGSGNAYTSRDITVYYQDLPLGDNNENLFKVMEIEADRMQNLKLTEPVFLSEKKVIFEERKMRYENSPHGQLQTALLEAMFAGTPYEHSIIGSNHDLASIRITDIENYYQRYYGPSNAVIVVSGAVEAKGVFSAINKYYQHMDKASDEVMNSRKMLEDPELYKNKSTPKDEIKLHSQSPHLTFMLGYHAPTLKDEESTYLNIFSTMLTEGKSAPLNQRYVYGDHPVFAYLHTSPYFLLHRGAFIVMGQLLPKTPAKYYQNNLNADLKQICQDETVMNTRNLSRAKNVFTKSILDHLRTNDGLGSVVGENEVYFNDWKMFEKDLVLLQSADLSHIQQSCQQIFSQKPFVVSVWDKYPKKEQKP